MSAPAPGPARGLSATVPLRYLATAAGAFLLAALGAIWLAPELTGHYYHPRLFALAHTVTLGWITMTIVGACYQIGPIVLERPIWSERLARWQFVALVVGVAGLVPHFFIGRWSGVAWAAALVAAALGAHAVNMAVSMRRLARWTFTARMLALGHAGLALTALSGLLLGVDRAWRVLPGDTLANLHAHVQLALLGWVLPVVLGVAARVYPMFLLAPEPAGAAGAVQLWGLALGVPAMVVGLAIRSGPVVIAGALAVACAVAGHLIWMLAVVRNRKRPALDWPLRLVLTGTMFLVPAAVVGLGLALDLLSGPRMATTYVVLALGGWASLTIVGMMLKIVPFLVWYRVYGPRVGRAPVPTLAELSSPRAEAIAYALLLVGFAALAAGTAIGNVIVVRFAAGCLVGGALAFAAALAQILAHLAPPTAAGPVARALRGGHAL